MSYEEIERNECTVVEPGKTYPMGGDFAKGMEKPKGIFYLETNENPPYAIRDIEKFTIKRSYYS